MLITIPEAGIAVNAEYVVEVMIENRFYANGSSSILLIKMLNGTTHRIEHCRGVDVHAIQKKIEEAMR